MPLSRDFYRAYGEPFDANKSLDENSNEHKFLEDSGYFKAIEDTRKRHFDDDDPAQQHSRPEFYFDDPNDFNYDNVVNNNNFSMVDNYFANINNQNLGISSDYMNTYNKAKDNLAKTLNMTSNVDQYGYTANMSASNIYYDYLKEQGLI